MTILVVKNRPFAALRGKLTEYGIDQQYLAEYLGISPRCMVARLNAESQWDLDEMWMIMDLIEAPETMLHKYFPPRQDVHRIRKQQLQKMAKEA